MAKRNRVENAIYCCTNRLSLNKHILAVNEVIIALFFVYGHITVNFISKLFDRKSFKFIESYRKNKQKKKKNPQFDCIAWEVWDMGRITLGNLNIIFILLYIIMIGGKHSSELEWIQFFKTKANKIKLKADSMWLNQCW